MGALPFLPLPSLYCSHPLFCLTPPSRSLPFLEVGPLNTARGLGERCKLPQWGMGQSPTPQMIWCKFESKSAELVAAFFVEFFSRIYVTFIIFCTKIINLQKCPKLSHDYIMLSLRLFWTLWKSHFDIGLMKLSDIVRPSVRVLCHYRTLNYDENQ